ncbi:MAG: KpsF/GutQ family sugar-phosphate isomerase [Chitinivibrionales bacterium]
MNVVEKARRILEAEAQAIRSIPLGPSFEHAIDVLYSCKGKIITTGMGKAGNIAMKMASTLCSTGSPAAHLHPGDATHGDLGLIGPEDVIVAYSNSGKTREIVEMLLLAKRLGVTHIIGITSHPDTQIREICDIVIDMGLVTEPCHLGFTPTASTAVMLAIGDALSLVLAEKRGLTAEQYGLRHHGGYLGEQARKSKKAVDIS